MSTQSVREKYSITGLEISKGLKNRLYFNEIHTVEDLLRCSEHELLSCENLGPITVKQVVEALAKIGLSLRRS